MSRLANCLLTIGITLLTQASLFGQDAKLVEGTLSMGGKPYKLLHAVAYEVKIWGKPGIAILASDRPINLEVVKAAIREKPGDADVSLRQPHLKVMFDASGKPSMYYATAAGFTTNASDGLFGEIKNDSGRVTGKAKLTSQGEGDLQRSFDFQFATGLVGSSAEPTQQTAPLAKLGVSGTFKGNGKDSRLAFVSARTTESFADKPSLKLIFTERDHSRDSRPDMRAAFGDFGSALIISCHEDGRIFGCEVAHSAHAKKPFSSIGSIDMGEFQIAGGQVQGKLATGGQVTAFDQNWETNLQFAAPFVSTAKTSPSKSASSAQATASNTEPAKRKSASPATTDATPTPAAKSVATLNVRDLVILQGVENVEYKKLVEHVSFQSPTDYKTLAAELAKKLQTQGWTSDGRDLIGVSAILKRKMGDASLTIFVKPAAEGSQVNIMTKGLLWDK